MSTLGRGMAKEMCPMGDSPTMMSLNTCEIGQVGTQSRGKRTYLLTKQYATLSLAGPQKSAEKGHQEEQDQGCLSQGV